MHNPRFNYRILPIKTINIKPYGYSVRDKRLKYSNKINSKNFFEIYLSVLLKYSINRRIFTC